MKITFIKPHYSGLSQNSFKIGEEVELIEKYHEKGVVYFKFLGKKENTIALPISYFLTIEEIREQNLSIILE